MPHSCEVEYARSNASTCRVCLAKIPKGDLRIGPRAGALMATRWHHFKCFPRMTAQNWMLKNLPADPSSLNGLSTIKKSDQKKVCTLWKAQQMNRNK